ncbi:hypothetical protein HYDPIDRAFT_33012 [Hydnomerulius pinastri MD-312]|uniref:Uncharacterized protein n=1 Tax=Hydnomerulius pinastri MD-312 TaxID=994086 RepID=A0A0C9W1D4_9AGAM|nr:hypothetical protein HYDPIDRAFT_33012 [Hydnomerulius pinastri MD-312]
MAACIAPTSQITPAALPPTAFTLPQTASDAFFLGQGSKYDGVGFEGKVCGVSILCAGEAMEAGLREGLSKCTDWEDPHSKSTKAYFYSVLPY